MVVSGRHPAVVGLIMSDLSFFPLAVMIARNQAAPILAKVAEAEEKRIAARQARYEEQIDLRDFADSFSRGEE